VPNQSPSFVLQGTQLLHGRIRPARQASLSRWFAARVPSCRVPQPAGSLHSDSRRLASRHFRGINEPPLRAAPHIFHVACDAAPWVAPVSCRSAPALGVTSNKRGTHDDQTTPASRPRAVHRL